MSEIDASFSRKAAAFTRGQVEKVTETLAECSTIWVGQRSFDFEGRNGATAILDRYRKGLRRYGYSHTLSKIVFQDEFKENQAYVLAEYIHFDFDGEMLDTLQASYFLNRDAPGAWRASKVEFIEEPLGFAA